MRRTLLIIGTLHLLCAGALAAQTLEGRAVEAERAVGIPQAVVVLLGERGDTLASTLTGGGGRFRFLVPGPGRYALGFRHLGYEGVTTPAFALDAGMILQMDFPLAPRPIELAPVTATVERSRAEETVAALGLDVRALGGRLITRAKLEPFVGGARDAGDLIRAQHIAGLVVEPVKDPFMGTVVGACIRFERGWSSRECAPIRVLQTIAPGSIESIVVLRPSESGWRYGTVGSSGVVLIYTRDGSR
jgi:hypothetical protein